MKSKKSIIPYVFVAPAVIYIFIVTIIPVLMALPISFTDWSALSPEKNFVGFDNYIRLLSDKNYWISCLIMAKFFIYVPIVMAVGLGMAILLNNKIKGIKIFRVFLYSPVITSTVAVAILFDWFYQPTFGLFNSILENLGLDGIGWISDPNTAVMAVIIFKVWKDFGMSMLIYLASLQDIPSEVYEAAKIDGASEWQYFKSVVFPLLKPAHVYLLITNVINVFMIFQETYMLKGPLNSTRTVVNYIFEAGFERSEMGYASSMSFVLFLIIMIITIIQFKITKSEIS
ncbi:carbohydrate ABC transporter permease [Enterococcus massiliensis]|uniref:carbohydrate ABC transporter permease n=1 Tax=Enterococcus massiliensis TaxID=1640685 RepID=UPI00065E021D|nr:sugar ABC transporter permease [Enterococcus massiliensis]